jgi:isopentenyl-diphosphate delta-isomerase
VLEAAKRRLQEEMGMQANMKEVFHFLYEATLDQGLSEHELDHVLVGYTNENPLINPEEVHAFKWIAMNQLIQELEQEPDSFTIWFQILLQQHLETITKAANESM